MPHDGISSPSHQSPTTTEPNREITAWRLTGGRCWYCGIQLTRRTFSVDHVIPRSGGGSGLRRNKVVCCRSCNSSKRDKTLEEFRAFRRRQREGMPLFTREQLAYFEQVGIELPLGEPFLFWFELEGLEV